MNRICVVPVFVLGSVSAALGQDRFPDGVASGDLTATSAILWTRAGFAGQARAEVATDESFATIAATATASAASEQDTTVKIEVFGLAPLTQYFYRFVALDDGSTSPIGRFRTAPREDQPAALRFAFSGDTNFAFAPFGVASQLALEDVDAFVWFGDTIYADVSSGGLGVATTLDDYRAKYRQIRSDAGIRSTLTALPIWVGGDDHEVKNDYAGLDPDLSTAQRDAGYQAFFEYMPIRDQGIAEDQFRAYRRIRYGANAVLLFLDARQYRDASAKKACSSNPDPYGFVLGPLTADGDCQAELSAPRAMLGRAQLDWLMQELVDAGDAVKFVVNNVPFSYIGAYPYDRWDGYDDERRELLEFIHDNRIRNVIFLTTDIHANAYNPDVSAYFRRHRPDYHLSRDIVVPEIITGPLGNATFHQSVTGIGPGVLQGATGGDSSVLDSLENLLIRRLRCADKFALVQTNRVSYVVVSADDSGVHVSYKGSQPENAHDPNSPIETFFETDVASQPVAAASSPCFLPLLVLGLTVFWTMVPRPFEQRAGRRLGQP